MLHGMEHVEMSALTWLNFIVKSVLKTYLKFFKIKLCYAVERVEMAA